MLQHDGGSCAIVALRSIIPFGTLAAAPDPVLANATKKSPRSVGAGALGVDCFALKFHFRRNGFRIEACIGDRFENELLGLAAIARSPGPSLHESIETAVTVPTGSTAGRQTLNRRWNDHRAGEVRILLDRVETGKDRGAERVGAARLNGEDRFGLVFHRQNRCLGG